jgi:hypothetical protein
MNYKKMHQQLIVANGGKVEDKFVIEHGISLIAKTELTKNGKNMFDAMNVFSLPDFNSKITYLNFGDKNLEKIVTNMGHLSIFNDTYVTILIAGVSLETALELIAHNEFKIARLTSSRTKAQLEPMFVVPFAYKNKIEKFKEYINGLLSMREKYFDKPIDKNEMEAYNNLPYKAISLTMSGNLKDWHKTMIGRLSDDGVEVEVQEIFKKINKILKNEFPTLIKDIDYYYSLNNNKKYEK